MNEENNVSLNIISENNAIKRHSNLEMYEAAALVTMARCLW
jgi:hypothetical protein